MSHNCPGCTFETGTEAEHIAFAHAMLMQAAVRNRTDRETAEKRVAEYQAAHQALMEIFRAQKKNVIIMNLKKTIFTLSRELEGYRAAARGEKVNIS